MPSSSTCLTSLTDSPPPPPRGGTIAWTDVQPAMEAHRAEFERQGAVIKKTTGRASSRYVIRWRSRSDGLRIQKSLPLGADPAVAGQAKALLREWQGAYDPTKSADPRIQEVWRIVQQCAASARPRAAGRRFLADVRPLLRDPPALLRYLEEWLANYRRPERRRPASEPIITGNQLRQNRLHSFATGRSNLFPWR